MILFVSSIQQYYVNSIFKKFILMNKFWTDYFSYGLKIIQEMSAKYIYLKENNWVLISFYQRV